MNNIKLSIIVPVYNVEKYLIKCLDSLVNQTFEDVEIILVEDCSTDGSKKICEDYCNRNKKIKLIKHDRNCGLSEARNSGLKVAKGEYITFVDSDDWVDIDMYEIMMNSIIATGADMAICGFKEIFNKNTKISKVSERDIVVTSEEALKMYFRAQITANSWNKIYKKVIFDDNNIMFQVGKFAEDQYPTFLSIFYSKSICLVSDTKYYYNRRNESLTTSNLSNKNYDVFEHLNLMKEFMKSKGCFEKYDLFYQVRYYKVVYMNIVKKIALSDIRLVDIEKYKIEMKKNYKENIYGILKNNNLSIKDKMQSGVIKYFPMVSLKLIRILSKYRKE